MHPLTIEDILQQDTREKTEHFDKLGYRFIVFRALDERYFRYVEASNNTSKTSFASSEDGKQQQKDGPLKHRQPGRLEIVEGVGGKEGVEGVGVGAVNLYLVIYQDGIISVSSLFPTGDCQLADPLCACSFTSNRLRNTPHESNPSCNPASKLRLSRLVCPSLP